MKCTIMLNQKCMRSSLLHSHRRLTHERLNKRTWDIYQNNPKKQEQYPTSEQYL